MKDAVAYLLLFTGLALFLVVLMLMIHLLGA